MLKKTIDHNNDAPYYTENIKQIRQKIRPLNLKRTGFVTIKQSFLEQQRNTLHLE